MKVLKVQVMSDLLCVGPPLAIGNDRNVTNRQFKKHCLAYEQNA